MAMISKISEGLTVSVETFYQPEYSNPINSEFMFAFASLLKTTTPFPSNY